MSNPKSYGWLLNHFIQIVSYDDLYLDYYDFTYKNCPVIDRQRIKKSFIYNMPITDVFENAINASEYIYLVINTKYISLWTNKSDLPHELFIYGYDKSKKEFYVSDNPWMHRKMHLL